MTAIETSRASTEASAKPRVAIAHDFLVSRGGAERVALTMARAFPGAPIHTALHDPGSTFDGFANHEVRPLVINRVPLLHRHHRISLPLLQLVFARRVIEADVVLCSSSGFAHNVATSGRKLVYCHTPARWLHDQERYLDRFGPAARGAAKLFTRSAHHRDVGAMRSADRIVANSHAIGDQILEVYDRTCEVVAPCSSLTLGEPVEPLMGIEPGFVFCPSRALGYKRLDVLVAAARRLPANRFVQVGDGPDLVRLRRVAPANLRFLGEVTDAQLRWAYSNAALVALTSAEDFGLVPVEARAHGLMSVVPQARGLLDHVEDGVNGWFYPLGDELRLSDLIKANIGVRASVPSKDPLGELRFTSALRRIVDEVAQS